jgi:hypothetical protein
LLSSRAEAGIYGDELAKCMVRSSTPADHITLVRWMFNSLARHPALQAFASITPEQREATDRNVAALTQRLLLTDCHKEAVDGLKYEGGEALLAGFRVLGQVAARDTFSNPLVAKELATLGLFLDKAKVAALYKEAGVPQPPAAPLMPQ